MEVLKTLNVGLGDRSYPIVIGTGLGSEIERISAEYLQQGKKVVSIVDRGLTEAAPSFAKDFLDSVPTLSLPAGETTKSINFLSKVWDFLAQEGVDRTGVLFTMGGGVSGDLAGFAAASYLRGIDFYQVPTTLLAMVDSSVGGKTGINLSAGKNLVGSFHQPKAVIIDLNCLRTLPKREFSAGMAEVIKYGLLGNKELLHKLLSFSSPLVCDSPELPDIIESCCSDKAQIVKFDERETADGAGGRALLNLGHTFAHAVESVAGYGEYLHGEAVSIGLICAIRLSVLAGHLNEKEEEPVQSLLQSYQLPTRLTSSLKLSDLLSAMQSDKKAAAGNIRFVALREIGNAFVTSDIAHEDVSKVWKSVGVN